MSHPSSDPNAATPDSPFGTDITVADVTEALSFFDEWEDRYRYIIDLGKQLPEMSAEYKTDENFVQGCQSQVWLRCQHNPQSNRLTISVDSDAHIVKGLAAIILSAFNNQSPQAIRAFDIEGFFSDIDLLSHLSPTRGNGLRAMVKKIQHLAAQYE